MHHTQLEGCLLREERRTKVSLPPIYFLRESSKFRRNHALHGRFANGHLEQTQPNKSALYQSLLSRSEFQEGQVPLKATGSCSWCWKDSFHIQRLVNIVDLKVSVSYCGKNSAIVVDGERENAVEVGEGAMMVYAKGAGRGIGKRNTTGPHLLLLNTITKLWTHVLISCPQSAHVAPSSPRRIPLLAACPAPSSSRRHRRHCRHVSR